MGLLNGIRGQLRSVIAWDHPLPDDLFCKWSDNGDEIKNASKLIVGPGQGCIFVYEGRIRSVLRREGMVNLATQNIPFWTTISKVMQSFKSEHTVGIYFYKATRILDQKWGTTSPVKYNDPKYQFPVGLKAYGNYSFTINKPKEFFTSIVGGANNYGIAALRTIVATRMMQPLTDCLAEAGYSYAEIDQHRNEISQTVADVLSVTFKKLGLMLTDFVIEGTSFDDATMQRINRIADVTAESQAATAVGLTFAQLQQLEAMRDAAKNESGAAGAGMGLGAGMSFGTTMVQTMNANAQVVTPAPAAPVATERLTKLKKLLDDELITHSEYETKKKEILSFL